MQTEEEKGKLAGAIIKGALIGITIFIIFNQDFDYKKFFNIDTAQESEIPESVEEDFYIEAETEEELEIEAIGETDNNKEIFSFVEEMPKFKGCEHLESDEATQCTMKKIQSYTAQVEYPQIAIDNDIEGKVYIRFVVDAKGNVSEVKLLRGVDKLLDNAALNHIKKMPKFDTPGKQRGKAVKVQYNIPIVFKLG